MLLLGGGRGEAHGLDERSGVARGEAFEQRLKRRPRSAIAAPTQRGVHTRADRRSMPRSIASIALDSGAGLRRDAGQGRELSASVDGWAGHARTRSVSMKPKYAQPMRAPLGAVSPPQGVGQSLHAGLCGSYTAPSSACA